MLIYADFNFNGLEDSPASPDENILYLTGYGTLASLSLHQGQLHAGQHLMLCDRDGLRVMGKIGFDLLRQLSHHSGWFASFRPCDMQECAPLEHDFATHLCFKCRMNLKPYLDKVGQQFNESCPYCGTPVMFSLLPPEN